MLISKNIKSAANKFWLSIVRRADESESAFIPLGFLFFLGYLGWYIMWQNVEIQAYENLSLRLIGSFIGLPLIFKNYWPTRMKFLMPAYWYLSLLYLMPFFFSFMLFKNDYSVIWQLNGITALVLLILVTEMTFC